MEFSARLGKHERFYRYLVTSAGLLVLLGCALRALSKPQDGDFALHWETGLRFLRGEFLYSGGHDLPYPPFFAMLFAPAALLPMPVAKALFYPVGVAALLILIWTMDRLVRAAFSLNQGQVFWAGALALVVAIQFLIRDQAELGLNTAVIALSWLGILWWREGRDLRGAVSLGLAIAMKCTPAIFLAYFAWKRQWRMAAYSAATTLLFTIAPMLCQGPVSWSNHMQKWFGNAVDGISGGGFESAENFRDRNMALRPVVMRYLTNPQESGIEPTAALPPVDLFKLPPTVARWMATVMLLALVALFAWWSRRPLLARDDPRILWELAGTGILMLLLSPVTWMQTCVALLPAGYVIAALFVAQDQLPRWTVVLLLLEIIFCSLLGRDVVGRSMWVALASHHVITFCIIGLLAIVLAGPRLQRR